MTKLYWRNLKLDRELMKTLKYLFDLETFELQQSLGYQILATKNESKKSQNVRLD